MTCPRPRNNCVAGRGPHIRSSSCSWGHECKDIPPLPRGPGMTPHIITAGPRTDPLEERFWPRPSVPLLVLLPPPGMSPHLFLQPSPNVTFPKRLPSSTAPRTSLIPPIYSLPRAITGDSHELLEGRHCAHPRLGTPVNTGHGPNPLPSRFILIAAL